MSGRARWLVALAVLLVAAYGVHVLNPSVSVTPSQLVAGTTGLLTFNVSSDASSADNITEVNVTFPTNFTVNGNGTVPSGWNFTKVSQTAWFYNTSAGGLSNGTSANFVVNVTADLTNATVAITIDTKDAAGGTSSNTTTVWIRNDAPNVTLLFPGNASQINNTQNYIFNYTATDDTNTTLNCTLFLDGTVNSTNSSVPNATTVNVNISGISYASHSWNVTCSDSLYTGNSETRAVTFAYLASNLTVVAGLPASVSQLGSTNLSAFVNNTGNGTASSVYLNWTLPSGWTISSGNSSNSVATLAPAALLWNNVTVAIAATAATGPATVNATTTNTSSAGNVTVFGLSANATLSPNLVNVTETRSFNLTIGNNATGNYTDNLTAVNGTLTSFTLASVSAIGASWNCSYSGPAFSCYNGTNPIANDTSLILNITANSSVEGTQTVILNATGSLGGVVNLTSTSLTVERGAVFSVSPAGLNINQTRQFNLTLANTGVLNITAVNGTLSSNLSNFNLTSDVFGSCTKAGVVFGCSNGSTLQTGRSSSFTLWLNATNSAAASFNITANYTTGSFFGNVTPATVAIQQAAQLNVTQIAFSSTTPTVGTSFSVTATVQNTGGAGATGVALTLSIASGCTFATGQSSSATLSPSNLTSGASGTASWSATCDASGSAVAFTVGYRGSAGDNYDNNTGAAIPSSRLIGLSSSVTPAAAGTAQDSGGGAGGTSDPSLALTFAPDTLTLKPGETKTTALSVKLNNPPSSGYLSNLVMTLPTSACCSSSIDPESYTTVNSTSPRAFTVTIRALLSAAGGDYNLEFKATAGIRSATKTFKVTVQAPDTAAPVVTIAEPKNQTYHNLTLALDYSVNEATSLVTYSLDGGTNTTVTGKTTFNTTEGGHNLTIYAKDTAGNLGKAAVFFSVNLTVPTTTGGANSTVVEDLLKRLNTTFQSVNLTVSGLENVTVLNTTKAKLEEAALLIEQAQEAFLSGNFTLSKTLGDQAQKILDEVQGAVTTKLEMGGEAFNFGQYLLPAVAAAGAGILISLIIKSGVLNAKKPIKYDFSKVSGKATTSMILKEISSEVNEPKGKKPKD